MSVRPAFLAASILSGFFITSAAISQESKPVEPKVEPKGLMLDDLPAIFVPARPGTLDQKKELEVTELFAAARAHESRREWNEAVTLLEDCIKIDPDNAAVLRRLSRLNLALGKMDQGVGYAKKSACTRSG